MKRLIALLLSLLLMFCLVACGDNSASQPAAQPQASTPAAPAAATPDPVTLKVHMPFGTTDVTYEAACLFKDEAEKNSNGLITVELYPSNQLGTTADCLDGLALGTCQVVFESIANLVNYTDLANVDLPYLYSGDEHYRLVWEGEVGQNQMNAIGEAANMAIFGAGMQGARVVTSTVPITCVADVKGFKLRVPTVQSYIDTWDWLGATPTPLSSADLFTALQQGVVTGQENPYSTSVGFGMLDCCNYVTETKHMYTTDVYMFDKKYFNSLPAEFQTVLKEAAEKAGAFLTDRTIETTQEYKQQFIDAGFTIYDDIDIKEWMDAFDGFVEEKYPMMLDFANAIKAIDPVK